jgi:hypothetical protein
VLDDVIAKFSLIYSIIGGNILTFLYIDYHSSSNIEFGKKGLNLLQIIYWSVWITILICPVLYYILLIFDISIFKTIYCSNSGTSSNAGTSSNTNYLNTQVNSNPRPVTTSNLSSTFLNTQVNDNRPDTPRNAVPNTATWENIQVNKNGNGNNGNNSLNNSNSNVQASGPSNPNLIRMNEELSQLLNENEYSSQLFIESSSRLGQRMLTKSQSIVGIFSQLKDSLKDSLKDFNPDINTQSYNNYQLIINPVDDNVIKDSSNISDQININEPSILDKGKNKVENNNPIYPLLDWSGNFDWGPYSQFDPESTQDFGTLTYVDLFNKRLEMREMLNKLLSPYIIKEDGTENLNSSKSQRKDLFSPDKLGKLW